MKLAMALLLSSLLVAACGGRRSSSDDNDKAINQDQTLYLSEVPKSLQEDMQEGTFFRRGESGNILKFEPTDFKRTGIREIVYIKNTYKGTRSEKAVAWVSTGRSRGLWTFNSDTRRDRYEYDLCDYELRASKESEQQLVAIVENMSVFKVSYHDEDGDSVTPEETNPDVTESVTFFYENGSSKRLDTKNPHLMSGDLEIFQFMESQEAAIRDDGEGHCYP